MAEKELWLIDTDCGVDDAQALVLAFSHTEALNYDVVAITTTVGNTIVDHVDKNVAEVLRICERTDVPIYRGAEHPILRNRTELFGAAEVHGNDGMNGYWGREFGDKPEPELKKVEDMPAALAIIKYLHDYDGKLNVITIGPLTNLATAVLIDRSITEKVKRLVVMGGAVTGKGNITHAAEFNIWADPEASNIVLDAFPRIEIIDWELSTSEDHSLSEAFLEKYKNCMETPKGKFVHSVTTAEGMLFFADALAMAVAIDPNLVTKSTDRECYLEMFGPYSRGMMIVNW